jgi:hypothetical protein
MKSVDAIGARTLSAAMVLIVLATPLFFQTRPAASGDDKAPAKALPAELAKATRDGDLKAVRAQLDGGVDVNARDAEDNTPLHLAAIYAGPECVELLLKKGADWSHVVRSQILLSRTRFSFGTVTMREDLLITPVQLSAPTRMWSRSLLFTLPDQYPRLAGEVPSARRTDTRMALG